ncbi:MAG: CPBP family intramembrane metalloprotease [Candidatus Nomurabacteria bacterium]|jgi:membrane protease YdiL (CAAX protease family)|nr:CPBP family intramembrane metalloprotease [Candidatus Nomurabacteria bacterium]
MKAEDAKNNAAVQAETGPKKAKRGKDKWLKVLYYAAGVMLAFYAVQYITAFALYFIFGDKLTDMVASSVFSTVISAVMYAVILVVVLVVPVRLFKQKLSTKELGVQRWPSWMDILLSPAAFIVYMIAAAILTTLAAGVLPWYDVNQAQDVGFSNDNLVSQVDYILAFISLVVVAPVVEEMIFRGYLYGKLRGYVGIVVSTLIVSVLFGVAHGQWNVGVNVFAMSLVLCGLRELTGNIWSGVLLHMLKNGIAYYFLFVNTTFLTNVMGG